MPIKIPDNLPAVKTLEGENIFVMTEKRAITQDIRPLRILVLNLMPKKIVFPCNLHQIITKTLDLCQESVTITPFFLLFLARC